MEDNVLPFLGILNLGHVFFFFSSLFLQCLRYNVGGDSCGI